MLDIDRPVLLLQGYSYASESGFLTIVRLSQEKGEVIFNDKFELNKIDKEGRKYFIRGLLNDESKTIEITSSSLSLK